MNDLSGEERKRKLIREGIKGFGVLVLLVLMMMWLAGTFVDKVEPGPPHPKPQPSALKTRKAEFRSYPLVVEQVGTVRSRTEAFVASRIMAQVKEILVREGDMVVGSETAGDSATVLARLDDSDVRSRLRQAEAQISAMEQAVSAARARMAAAGAGVESARAARDRVATDFKRYEDLHRNRAATGQQLDHARTERDMAEARLRAAVQEAQAARSEAARVLAQREQAEAAAAEARAMLDFTVIRAPFSGRLLKRMIQVGDMAAPGQPLFFVETPSRPELHAHLSESLLPHVQTGQETNIRVDALGVGIRGVLSEIVPKSDPATRTVLVKVALDPHPGLVNGLFGRFSVICGEVQSLVVPFEAVRERGQLHLLDVLDSTGGVQRRFVTLGQRRDDLVEILSGLKEDEEVVVP